jgi:hypothetical protein
MVPGWAADLSRISGGKAGVIGAGRRLLLGLLRQHLFACTSAGAVLHLIGMYFSMEHAMTLTVRLDPTLASALERHCAATGASKSHVVQECLASYLQTTARAAVLDTAHNAPTSSPAFQAFASAGLVGAVALPMAGGADKAAVRAQVAARAQARHKPT